MGEGAKSKNLGTTVNPTAECNSNTRGLLSPHCNTNEISKSGRNTITHNIPYLTAYRTHLFLRILPQKFALCLIHEVEASCKLIFSLTLTNLSYDQYLYLPNSKHNYFIVGIIITSKNKLLYK